MKKEKKIGVALLIIAVVFLAFVLIQYNVQKKKASAEQASEKIIDTKTEEELIPKTWDGDSVQSDFKIKDDFVVNGLNEEVLALIGNDTKTLSETMQAYLYATVSENYMSATSNGLISIDYNTNKIYLTFEVVIDRTCTLKGIYDREKKTWEFSEETY